MGTLSLKERLQHLRDALLTGLIERDTPVRLALLAALAGEHLLLIGPPGTAKSEIARRLPLAFREAPFVERLLTRFSAQEELFGPLSVKALEEDRYLRQVRGYLPSAALAFVDQLFNANPALLNSLLTLLNEREFDMGGQRMRTPLLCVIGAGTFLPVLEELDALLDRFLLRCYIPPLPDESFEQLLDLKGRSLPNPPAALRLSLEEVKQIQKNAQQVEIPLEIRLLLKGLRQYLAEQDIPVSDRRWRKILFLLQVSAYTDGRAEVSVWDAWLLQHCTWQSPEQQEGIFEWYKSRLGTHTSAEPDRFGQLVDAWEKTLEEEKNATWQARDPSGRLYYRNFEGKPVKESAGRRQKMNEKGEPLYLIPADQKDRTNKGKGYNKGELMQFFGYHYFYANQDAFEAYLADKANWFMEEVPYEPIVEPTRYSAQHIQNRKEETRRLADQADTLLKTVEREIDALETLIDQHLWISPGFTEVAGGSLLRTREQMSALRERIQAVHQGFGQLLLRHEG